MHHLLQMLINIYLHILIFHSFRNEKMMSKPCEFEITKMSLGIKVVKIKYILVQSSIMRKLGV